MIVAREARLSSSTGAELGIRDVQISVSASWEGKAVRHSSWNVHEKVTLAAQTVK